MLLFTTKEKPITQWIHCQILSKINTRTNTDNSHNFCKTQSKHTPPIQFYGAGITLIRKPDKDTYTKKIIEASL
jgi:hypothetical protein